MAGTTPSRGNILSESILQLTITPTALTTLTSSVQTFTIPGLVPASMYITTSGPSAAQTTGISIINCWVSAANTVSIQFYNGTAGTLTPVAGAYIFDVAQVEAPTINNTNFPTAF
jgi:hypothetical protein